MAILNLSSPWVEFYREIEAMFKEDPQIKVVYDEEGNTVKLYVEDSDKADALSQILPTEKSFGNVTINIEVIPANVSSNSKFPLFRKAFEGNPVFSYATSSSGVFEINYVVFKNKVVQYPNDDISDVNGLRSTLYQNIADDIFTNREGIYFCTDVE